MEQPRKPFTAELQLMRRAGALGRPGFTPGVMDPASTGVGSTEPPRLAPPAPVVAPAPTPTPAPSPPPPIAVNVELGPMLGQLADINAKLDRLLSNEQHDIDRIHVEIADISGRIKSTKVEIAALRHPLAKEDKFQQASEELSAVVAATEGATDAIMGAAERIDELLGQLRAHQSDRFTTDRVSEMGDLVVRIFEACNFQDLTGQRINKVVRTLAFIDERVNAMMGLWNQREFEAMPLPPDIAPKDESGLEMHGPAGAANNQGISQADIDALFG